MQCNALQVAAFSLVLQQQATLQFSPRQKQRRAESSRQLPSSVPKQEENSSGNSGTSTCRASVARAPSLPVVQPEIQHCSDREISFLKDLVGQLQFKHNSLEKVLYLQTTERVRHFCKDFPTFAEQLESLNADLVYVLLCLPAMGQEHVLQILPADDAELRSGLFKLAETLYRADVFYSSLGGLIGYQAKCLELMQQNMNGSNCSPASSNADVRFHMPQGPNLDDMYRGRQIAAVEAAKGLDALPHMAEIWPLGGAGDRLGLQCELSGRSVPTAMLPYCGRTLLEGLVRDLQARESLYFKLYGSQHVTPVVIMTSDAKDNHRMVLQTLDFFNWFGRGKENFRVIRQPLVPVVSATTGKWVLPAALAPMLKPGGHGAVWKLMLDEGVFTWLSSLDRQAALIRQISNPMAGTDATMLALTGAGYADGRTFGFASCERTVGAAEGMNVLMQRRLPKPDGSGHEYAYNVTNVEYTEFERLGICDQQADYSLLPANTNILYVSLKAAEGAVKAGVAAGGGAALPGMIFNSKKTVTWTDAISGKRHCEQAGRMECTMQNLVDSLAQRFQEPIPKERHSELNTFVVFNKRRRVTSSAKRKRIPGSTVISQTPDGSFLDLMRNSYEVLQRSGFCIPEVGTVEQYLEKGPGFIFLFHPGLGPLWDVISQKLRGGAIAPGSELVLEVGEVAIADLRLNGSLTIEADCVHGRSQAAVAMEDVRRGTCPPVSGQAVRYQESGSEAIQYSPVMPDLAETSGTVVPLARRSALTAAGLGGTQERERKADELLSELLEDNGTVVFSSRCARARLTGVVIHNQGIDWSDPSNVYWKHKVARREQVRIVLHGQSEFEASHVALVGSHIFEVPDGYKMVVSAAPGGGVRRALYPLTGRRPSWQWRYLSAADKAIQLHMEEPISLLPGVPLSSRPAEAEMPFTYII